jgi:hypothetical protein
MPFTIKAIVKQQQAVQSSQEAPINAPITLNVIQKCLINITLLFLMFNDVQR